MSTLAGDIEARDKGSLVAHENGVATPFGITGAQSRGVMMVSPKDEIYRDMIIGLHQRPGDLRVNICKVSNGAGRLTVHLHLINERYGAFLFCIILGRVPLITVQSFHVLLIYV